MIGFSKKMDFHENATSFGQKKEINLKKAK